MRVLITGAAGRLGSEAVRHFVDAGHHVTATDAAHANDLPVPLHLLDLRDDAGVYNLLGGVEAVLHLGNHPNAMGSLPRQRLLTDNVSMTANVLYAAVDRGVRRIVYASSVQATMNLPARPRWWLPWAPCPFPRLPMDGEAPARTGASPYGISKAHGEHLLALCETHEDLAGVALRLPGIAMDSGWSPPQRPLRAGCQKLAEGLSLLHVNDACRLYEAAPLCSPAGYRCHFPSSCRAVAGIGPAEIARRFLGHVPVTGDLRGPGGLVDLSVLEAELGWVPREATPLLYPEE